MNRDDAYLILNYLPDIGPLRINALINFFGTPEDVLSADKEQLKHVQGIGERIASTIINWHEKCDVEQEKEFAHRAGVKIITREDSCYPPLLKQIHDPPVCLYLRGDMEVLRKTSSSVAMVGSRQVTNYGAKMAEILGTAAAMAGWPVVSGLARGIDTLVHEAVTKMNGCAIAVLGSGLGKIYPQENVQLARKISEYGAVISEFPMQFAPMKRTFPMRNRIISGITKGTIVLEAGHRSGSLITADQALDQNRLVFAVPGRADSPQSRGCNQLIKDGATLVENFDDVLENLSFLPGFGSDTNPRTPNKQTEENSEHMNSNDEIDLTEAEAELLDHIGPQEISIDNLVAELGQPVAQVFQTLFALEMKKLVRQLPGKRVVRNE